MVMEMDGQKDLHTEVAIRNRVSLCQSKVPNYKEITRRKEFSRALRKRR